MNRYEAIFESLQDKLDRAVLTPEIAERLNTLAYEKYVVSESKKDDDLAMLDSLREKIDSGEVKLSKDIVEELQGLMGTEEDTDTAEEDTTKEEPAKEEKTDKKEEKNADDKEADENAEGIEATDDTENTEEVKEESVEEVLTEGFDIKNVFKDMKRKFQMIRMNKENKAQVVALEKSYKEELARMNQAYKEAQEMLSNKFEARAKKLEEKYDAKINKLMD